MRLIPPPPWARRATACLALFLAAPMSLAAPACPTPESRQLDFWVGRWDVYPLAQPDRKVAESLIESLYGGCAIRENWMPLQGNPGGSLSAWDARTQRWRQTWVDAQGSWVEFAGAWNGEALVMEGAWPQPGSPHQVTRMSYRARPDGSVEQRGEVSNDGGRSYQPSWGFLYRRAP